MYFEYDGILNDEKIILAESSQFVLQTPEILSTYLEFHLHQRYGIPLLILLIPYKALLINCLIK